MALKQTLKEFSRSLPPCRDDTTQSSTVDDVRGTGLEKRQKWKPLEFLLSCIAMCVGLGNVWRFPYTAYKNGGGAFLIPYLIVLFLVGKPLYFLELSLGQFSSRGQVKVWKLSPIFKGVGYAAAFATCCITSYYCVLFAVSVFYFLASFSTELPWAKCNPSWKGVECINDTAWIWDDNHTARIEKSVSKLYLEQTVLHKKDNIDDGIGLPDWRLALCLLFSWVVLFGTLCRGVKSAGKAAYFTALFPYVVLIALFIRGVTLEGAWDGIMYFITPQWHRLDDPKVWFAAATQCFYSLSVGTGAAIMLGSYNKFEHNLVRDAKIITLIDTFTSLLSGCTIFAVLGYLAKTLNVSVADVTDRDTGLAFEAYPLAVAKFEQVPQLFAAIFFLMLFTIGIGSSTSDVGGIITIILDRFPQWNRTYVAAGTCITGFLLELVYVTPGGFMILDLVDVYGVGFVIFLTAILEVIAVAWVYGVNNMYYDLEFMLKTKLSWYWKLCWGAVIPISLSVLLIYEVAHFAPLEGYPLSATVCGWILSLVAYMIIPACALHVILTARGQNWKERLSNSWKPAPIWGPRDMYTRKTWIVGKLKTDCKELETMEETLGCEKRAQCSRSGSNLAA